VSKMTTTSNHWRKDFIFSLKLYYVLSLCL
jgi:hypothetical protein